MKFPTVIITDDLYVPLIIAGLMVLVLLNTAITHMWRTTMSTNRNNPEHWPLNPVWHPDFAPSYTPKEMIDLGVFEGIYTHAIDGIPKDWLNSPKVLPRGGEPDPSLNHYGVKSRQSLKEWQEKGWTSEHSPLGFWQWYCLYFLGRRIPEEDTKQIERWRGFIARHQAQVTKACRLDDPECHPRQRQGLLQWCWDSSTKFTPKQRAANVLRVSKVAGCEVGESIATEQHVGKPKSLGW